MAFVKVASVVASLLFCSSFSYSQGPGADTLARNNAIYLSKQSYQAAMAGNSPVFNGIEYIDPFQRKKLDGNPYFLSDEWLEGFLFYDGQLYENVSLRYNLFHNKLLIEHIQSHVTIELMIEKVKYFGIGNHKFVWLSGSSLQSDFREGFHELLYSGNTKVYARRYKTINEVIDQKTMVTKFTDKVKLFLYKEGQYLAISNKSSALNAFGDDKSQLKKFLSQENINFKSNPEAALIAMANYYDQMKK